jgi:hypothetical protein
VSEPLLHSVKNQSAEFSDGSEFFVPIQLTLTGDPSHGFRLILDLNQKVIGLGKDVTRRRLIISVNALKLSYWKAKGSVPEDKPTMLPIT